MKDFLKQDLMKLELFKKYGYDIPKARQFILKKAKFTKSKILDSADNSRAVKRRIILAATS